MALPPNELVALQCCVVRKVTIISISVMIPLLQQGMLCQLSCNSWVLLPSAVCFPASMCLGTLRAPRLVTCFTKDWSLPFVQSILLTAMQLAGIVVQMTNLVSAL